MSRSRSSEGGVGRMMFRQRYWIVASAVLLAIVQLAWIRLGPLPPGLLEQEGRVSTVVVDRRGEVLFDALSSEGARSRALEAGPLPAALVDATLAAEDHRFFSHPGVDPVAVLRAAWRNVVQRRIAEGGSTITQQTAKLLLNAAGERRGGRWRAKLDDAVAALRLESRLEKDEILRLYLDLAPYGNQFAGAERASHGYFGVSPNDLTPAQAAFIAGLPQRPSALDPWRNLSAAVARRDQVLVRMERLGMIDSETLAIAQAERPVLVRPARALIAPHFVERVRGVAGERPLRIETTLDSALQREVQGIIASHRRTLERHHARNVAIVVLDNRSGEWLAWEGSGDYFDAVHGGAIDGVVSPRQPGSTIKPFTYAVAFESGFDPASVLPDIPAHFPTAVVGVVYAPRNYDNRFRGPLRARQALAGSVNVPAVWLAGETGATSLLRLLRRSGISSLDRTAEYYGLGLTLGAAEMRLDELVAAYAVFARGGEAISPRMVRAIERRGGRVESPAVEAPRRLMSERTAFWISDILADADARSFVFGRGGSLEFPFPVAVKTGTSQAYHDNWTIGYTAEVTVGVWVGNFDRKPLRNSSGVTGAAPIFHAVMMAAQQRAVSHLAVERDEIASPTEDLVRTQICLLSGLAPTAICPVRGSEWLEAEKERQSCRWHHSSFVSHADGTSEQRVAVTWPPEYQAWAERHHRSTRGQVADTSSGLRKETNLRIVSPPDGATYLIDPTLRREFQAVPLRAVAASGRLRWEVNGRAIEADSSHWPLTPGSHEIRVVDERGRMARSTIQVR